jgi:hypothetical protein
MSSSMITRSRSSSGGNSILMEPNNVDKAVGGPTTRKQLKTFKGNLIETNQAHDVFQNNNEDENVHNVNNGDQHQQQHWFKQYTIGFFIRNAKQIFWFLILFFALNSMIFMWGRSNFKNVRYSRWFQFDGQGFMREQDEMIFEGEEYIRSQSMLRKNNIEKETEFLKQVWKDELEPDRRPFCIAIMSRARTKRYLIPEVTSILKNIDPQEEEMVCLIVGCWGYFLFLLIFF